MGIDRAQGSDADLIVDLDAPPYPLEDSSFDQILCQDVIEHVASPYALLEELHRVGRPGARLHIRTPHFSSLLAYSDLTHRRALSATAFRFLSEPLYGYYTTARFKLVTLRVDMGLPYRVLGIDRLANRRLLTYERYFAYWFPSGNVRAELEIVK